MQKDILWRCINVLFLGIGFTVAFSGFFINVSMTTALTTQLKGPVISTVPVGVHLMSGSISLVIAYFIIPRIGLRVTYISANLTGAVGSALMIASAIHREFGLLIVGTILQGPSVGVAQSYRFTSAAFFPAPQFSQPWRTRAISFTVGCAIFSAGLGVEATRKVQDNLEQPFTGGYVLMLGIYCAAALCTGLVDLKWLAKIQAEQQEQKMRAAGETDGKLDKQPVQQQLPKQHQQHLPGIATVESAEEGVNDHASGPPSLGPPEKLAAGNGVPLSGQGDKGRGDLSVKSAPCPSTHPALRQGLLSARFLMPAISGATAFITMTAITTSTPLSMKKAGHSSDLATFTIEAHIGSRYIPSLVVADLVALVRYLVCHLVSSRVAVLRLLACLVFLMPMPHLVFKRPSRCIQRDQGQSSSNPDHHHASRQQQQQQQQPPHIQPQSHHQCQQGGRVSLHQGLSKQLSTHELDHSCGSTSSSECCQPHMVVLVPNAQEEEEQQQQQQEEREQEKAGLDVPQEVRDTLPITAMMVLGSAILATSPGVLLAGESLRYFMGGLVLAGSGWALNYVAASSLVTAAFAHDPVRLRKGQTIMDLFVLTPMAPAAATVSVILTHWGWHQFLYLYMGIILALFLWNLILHVCIVPSGLFNSPERPKS